MFAGHQSFQKLEVGKGGSPPLVNAGILTFQTVSEAVSVAPATHCHPHYPLFYSFCQRVAYDRIKPFHVAHSDDVSDLTADRVAKSFIMS